MPTLSTAKRTHARGTLACSRSRLIDISCRCRCRRLKTLRRRSTASINPSQEHTHMRAYSASEKNKTQSPALTRTHHCLIFNINTTHAPRTYTRTFARTHVNNVPSPARNAACTRKDQTAKLQPAAPAACSDILHATCVCWCAGAADAAADAAADCRASESWRKQQPNRNTHYYVCVNSAPKRNKFECFTQRDIGQTTGN